MVIFGADTRAGRRFDLGLLVAIAASIVAVMLESIPAVRDQYPVSLRVAEWAFTLLLTLEYAARLYCVGQPLRFARSFFGVVDLLSILPAHMSLIVPGAQSLLVIRALRLLRAFRVLELARFVGSANLQMSALGMSRHKLAVFLGTVAIIVVIPARRCT